MQTTSVIWLLKRTEKKKSIEMKEKIWQNRMATANLYQGRNKVLRLFQETNGAEEQKVVRVLPFLLALPSGWKDSTPCPTLGRGAVYWAIRNNVDLFASGYASKKSGTKRSRPLVAGPKAP